MPLEINRDHHLDKATTRRKVEEIAMSLHQTFHVQYEWDGDRMIFEQTGVKGHIDVADHQVQVVISKSPFLPVSDDWIREQVEATLDRYLSNG